MEAIKNAISGKSGSSTQPSNQSTEQGQKQDYGDKAFKAVGDKAGLKLNDSQREKITDLGRSTYEKSTGKKVDPKWSN